MLRRLQNYWNVVLIDIQIGLIGFGFVSDGVFAKVKKSTNTESAMLSNELACLSLSNDPHIAFYNMITYDITYIILLNSPCCYKYR